MRQLDLITKDKQAVRWRQSCSGFDGISESWPAIECATDQYRASVVALRDSPALADKIVLQGCNPPNLAAVWPRLSTLPHALSISCGAVPLLAALGKYAESQQVKKRHKTRPIAGCITRIDETSALVEINGPLAKARVTVFGVTCPADTCVSWNITFLAEAAETYGGTLHFESAVRPGLFIPHVNAPEIWPRTLIMPVNQ